MRAGKFVWLGLLSAPLMVAALPAAAQGASQPASQGAQQGPSQAARPSDSDITFGGMLKSKEHAGPAPAVAAPPSAWPRLDPGAVLCRSQGDLQRRAALMRGEQVVPPDCRPINQPTAIKILVRVGPGATEVQLTSNSQTGWTDAWLPATPPLNARNR